MVKRKRSVVLAGAVVGVVGLIGWTENSAAGGTITWSGADSNTFGYASNWLGGVAPGSGDIAYFASTTTASIPYTPDFDGADSVLGFQIYNNTGTGGLVWSLPRDGSSDPRTISIGSQGIYLTGGGTTTWGAVTTTLAANQTWFVDANTTLAFVTGDGISGTGNLDKTGTGTVILPNASETGFSGNVTIDSGVLINNRSGTGTGTGSLTVDSGGTYLVSGANAQVPAGYILNSGGTMLSTGGGATSGTYAGLGSGGVLQVNNGGSGTVYLGTLQATDYFTMYPAIVGGDGTGTISITGTGIVQPIAQYNGTNSYNGAWNVNSGGTLRSYTVDSLGDHSTTGNATNDFGANPIYLGNGSVDFAGTSLASAYPAFNNPITMIGNGTIAIDEDSANTVYGYYQHPSRGLGNLTIGNNTLNVTYTANVMAVSTAGYPVNFGVPTLYITAATPTINTVEPSTIGTELLVTNIVQTDPGAGLIKTGAGNLAINGSNPSFNGPISLEGGEIRIATSGVGNSLGTSLVTMSSGTNVLFNNGATAYTTSAGFAGTGTVGADDSATLTLAGGTISPGLSNSAGILTFSNKLALTKNGSSVAGTLDIGVFGTNGVAGTDFSQVVDSASSSSTNVTGLSNYNLVLTIAPGLTGTFPTMAIISDPGVTSNSAFANLAPNTPNTSIAGYTYSYTDVSGAVDLTVTATPEPASAVLMLGGVSYLGSRRRIRRYKNG